VCGVVRLSPQACPIRRVALRTGVWGVRPLTLPASGHGRGRGACWSVLCGEEAWRWCPKGHSLRGHPLCRARVVPERALGGQVLSISPGAVAPCQSASPLGRGRPDPGGLSMRGARPGGVLDRWSRRCSKEPGGATGEPGRVLPHHTRGVSASRLCSGESTLSPGFVRVLCPHEGDRQCSRGSAREPGGAQHDREFCPPAGRRALTAGPYGPLPFWRWVPCPGESAGDPNGSGGVGSLGSYGGARPRLVLSLPVLYPVRC